MTTSTLNDYDHDFDLYISEEKAPEYFEDDDDTAKIERIVRESTQFI